MLQTVHKPCLMLQRLLTIALLSGCTSAQSETLIITDRMHPVTKIEAHRVILLDEQQRLEEQLTSRLPSDPTQAASAIQAYLASPKGTRFQHELTQAQRGITDAWSVGVEKIPAVVVDRSYVVYGEADVDEAITLIDEARSAQR